MSSEKKNMQPGGSGVGEPPQKRTFSGPVRTGAEPFPGLSCSSRPGSLALGDRHLPCFRCLGAEHAAAASANPASCAACQALPDEELLSRHMFFSPSVELEAIDLFKAGVPALKRSMGGVPLRT